MSVGRSTRPKRGMRVRSRINAEMIVLVAWNDDETTTKQMVLDAFSKAEKIEWAGFDPDA